MQQRLAGWRVMLVGSLATALFVASASGQEDSHHPMASDLVFTAFAEHGPDSSVQLINGVTAIKKDWPTIINAPLTEPGVEPRVTCSAAFVGPGVFLTAAHCFDQGPGRAVRTAVWLNIGSQDIRVTCLISAEYLRAVEDQVWNFVKPRVSADFAICRFALPKVLPTALSDIQYENVDVGAPLAEGDSVLMTGYGCTNAAILASSATAAPNLDGLLRIGDARLFSVPTTLAPDSEQFAQIRSSLSSAPALCPGDSGGPLFTGVTAIKPTAQRRLRAVNSSVQKIGVDGGPVAISRVAPLFAASFRRLASQWLEANKGGTICGLNGSPGFLPCRE